MLKPYQMHFDGQWLLAQAFLQGHIDRELYPSSLIWQLVQGWLMYYLVSLLSTLYICQLILKYS